MRDKSNSARHGEQQAPQLHAFDRTPPLTEEAQQADRPIRTLDDIVHAFAHVYAHSPASSKSVRFTYRSFNVVDNGGVVTVELGTWSPWVRLFTPVGALVLSQSSLSYLIDQLQAARDKRAASEAHIINMLNAEGDKRMGMRITAK